MDDDAIIIQIELKNIAQAMAQIKKLATQIKTLNGGSSGSATSQQAKSAAQVVNQYNIQYRIQQKQYNLQKQQYSLNQRFTQNNSNMGAAAGAAAAAFIDLPIHPILALVTAIGAMTVAAISATTALQRIGYTSGGTQKESSQLSVIGGALGVDMASMSRAFGEAMAQGGIAAGFGQRAHLHDSGPFDTTDKAKNLLAWLKYLDTLSPTEAIRAARATPTEGLLPFLGLSDKTKQNLLYNDPATRAGVMNERTQRQMLELQVAFARLGLAAMNVVVPIVSMYESTFHVIERLNAFADWLNVAAKGLAYISAQMAALAANNPEDRIAAYTDMVSAGMDFLKAQIDAKQSEKDHKTAIDRNTESLERNTYAQRNGTYGGGERAHGAIPTKWGGMTFERNTAEVSKLGSFAL